MGKLLQNRRKTAGLQNLRKRLRSPGKYKRFRTEGGGPAILIMTYEEAVQVLVNAVAVAQNKGAYTLGDAKVVIEALQIVKPELFIQQTEEITE